MPDPTEFVDPPSLLWTAPDTLWTLRGRDRDGGLYAPAAVRDCPAWVLATEHELVTEHHAVVVTGALLEQRHQLDPNDAAYRHLATPGTEVAA